MVLWLPLLLILCSHTVCSQSLRRYYVAGSFTQAYNNQQQTSVVQSNGIAVYDDGVGWTPMSGGVNAGSEVAIVVHDDCNNTYIGGNFNSAGGVSTGPVAVMKNGTSNWESVITPPSFFAPGSTIGGISIDCSSTFPSCSTPCDIYLVGDFQYTIASSDVISLNFSAFIGGVWYFSSNEIQYGRTIFNHENSSRIFIGGSGLSPLNVATLQNNALTTASVQGVIGDINVIYSDSTYFSRNLVIVGGNFTAFSCSNLCSYNFVSNLWGHVALPQDIPPAVKAIARSGHELIVSGSFPQQIVTVSDTGTVQSFPNVPSNRQVNVLAIIGCSVDDSTCVAGSAVFGGDDSVVGYVTFYNATLNRAVGLGGGTNGPVISLASAIVPRVTSVGPPPVVVVPPSPSPSPTPTTTTVPTTPSVTTTSTPTPTPAGNDSAAVVPVDPNSIVDSVKIIVPVIIVVLAVLICIIFWILFAIRTYKVRKNKKRLLQQHPDNPALLMMQQQHINRDTERFIIPMPCPEQEHLIESVENLRLALRQNRFADVCSIAEEMDEMADRYALLIPNPSNIFIALISVMEMDQFQQSDVQYMQLIVRVVHKFARLTLLEKVSNIFIKILHC
jgi:hypothetical protein